MKIKALPLALLLMSILAACAGSTDGRQTSTSTSSHSGTTTQSAAIVPGESGSTSESSTSAPLPPPDAMPNYIGRQVKEASGELQSFNVRITETPEISNQAPGTVIRQDPQAGDPYPTTAQLWVSVAAPPVPNLVGMAFGEARTKLEAQGFGVSETQVLAEGKPDGTVVSQNPPEGTENVARVELGVAREPKLTYLAEWEPLSISSSCEREAGAREGNGELYSRAMTVSCSSWARNVAELEYDLSRDYQRIASTISLTNDSNSSGTAKVEVIGDGRIVASQQVKFGKTANFQAEITDVLRLTLRIAFSDDDVTIVFGDPTIEGFPENAVPSESPTS